MGRLFDNPMFIVLILLVIILLFGAPKLPGMARSLGQSMRIFKSEVKEMKDDDKGGKASRGENESTIVDGETVRDSGDRRSNGSTAADGAAPAASDSDGTVR
ncbi:Sec-independent protein translocase subunit TatA [Kocuria palustris]|uniref:Sec-independent protein translocase subunit TatA n=1 Tax=Kocuria palustris TaxID=71999 RepID=UPI0011A5778C|nr:Sec-independent protein translocase subunit TatA [Kocuria palustris]